MIATSFQNFQTAIGSFNMSVFSEKFEEVKKHINQGLYKDTEWVKNSIKLIKKLKTELPKEYSLASLADELNQPAWYVEQILMWCYLDDEVLEIELESHGSILFYYLKDYITEEEQEEIFNQLAKAKNKDSTAEHINSELLKRFEIDSTKVTKKLSKEEVLEKKFKELDTTVWEFLYTDVGSWDADDKFEKLVKKMQTAGKFNLNKSETLYFLDTLQTYINLGFLNEKSPKKKVLLYEEIKSFFG